MCALFKTLEKFIACMLKVQLEDFEEFQSAEVSEDDGTLESPPQHHSKSDSRPSHLKGSKSPNKMIAILDSGKDKHSAREDGPAKQEWLTKHLTVPDHPKFSKSNKQRKKASDKQTSKTNDLKGKRHKRKALQELDAEQLLHQLKPRPFDCDSEGRSRSPQLSPFQKVNNWIFAPQLTPEPMPEQDIELPEVTSLNERAVKRARKRKGKSNDGYDESVA